MLRPARLTFSLIFLLAISSAMAQDKNYVIIKAASPTVDDDAAHFAAILKSGPFNLEGSVENVVMDEPDVGVKLTEGIVFTKYLALEGTASWYGDMEVRANLVENNTTRTYYLNVTQYGLSFAALGKYPVFKWLNIYGKVGAGYNRMESSLDILSGGARIPVRGASTTEGELGPKLKRNRNEATPLFGAGVQVDILERLVASADWEQVEIDDLKVSSVSVGLGFRW